MALNNGFLPLPEGFSTIAIHEGQDPDRWVNKEVVIPISLTTIYKQETPGKYKTYAFARQQNPNKDVLERIIAKMEGGKHGVCFGSGMAAISAILTLLKPGDHIVCIDDIYMGTKELFLQIASNFEIDVTFSENGNFEKWIRPTTRMIFVESPTNPTLQIVDLQKVGELARSRNILFAVDNTFLTPYFQRPLDFGADVVMHSVTKYLNGYHDVCMGALVTNCDKLGDKFRFIQTTMGAVPSPFDCYQVIRGLKTFPLRMQQHAESALIIAKYLEGHPKIQRVIHPSLPSHPQYELSKKQTSGNSGMLSIHIKGDINVSKKFLNSLKVFTLAPSLGGTESLVTLVILKNHPEDQLKLDIFDILIRFSVGLEDTEDLIADLKQALDKI